MFNLKKLFVKIGLNCVIPTFLDTIFQANIPFFATTETGIGFKIMLCTNKLRKKWILIFKRNHIFKIGYLKRVCGHWMIINS